MDYNFFGTSDTTGLLDLGDGDPHIDHGTTQQNGLKSTPCRAQQAFQPDCAQCLESRDMNNGFCHGFSECYQDCASPCTGGDDCNLPEACYNENCETDMCEKQPCGLPPCTVAPCNDTSCPEGSCSIDTTCYDVNCFAGKDPGAYSYAHSVPQVCPPGQCQGFAPGLSMHIHGHQFQSTPFADPATGISLHSTWPDAAMFAHGLHPQTDQTILAASRAHKRRRVEDFSSPQSNYMPSVVNPVNDNFALALTNHLLQSHFGARSGVMCQDDGHNDVWLNRTLLQLGISPDMSDHLLHSHTGSQTLENCSINDHDDLWLNQTLQTMGQASSGINQGIFADIFSPVKQSTGTSFPAALHAKTTPNASPGTLHTPSTHTMSDIAIFSEDDFAGNSALPESATTTPEHPSPGTLAPGKAVPPAEEISKPEFDRICRWITDGPYTSTSTSTSTDKYPICGESFDSPEALDKHVRSVHVAALSKSFHCHWANCPSLLSHDFRHRGKLLRHIRGAHSHFHEHVCPHQVTTESGEVRPCGKTFCTKEQLKNHETKHTGERQYVCSYPGCTHRSATKTQHKTHERTHSGEKPYVCPVEGCNHRSGDSSNLSKHVRHRHPEYRGRGKGGARRKRSVSAVKAEGRMDGVVATT